MSRQMNTKRTTRLVALSLLFVVATSVMSARPVPAAETLKESTSLAFVPDDVAFYGAMLRNKEQYDAFVNSKAFAKLLTIPVVEGMVDQWEMLSSLPFGPMAMLQDPNNQQLLDMLGDMVSHEVFIYGDDQFGKLMPLFVKIDAASRMGQFQALLEGGGPGGGAATPRAIVMALNDNLDLLEVPNLVVGFKLEDNDRAKAQLKRLEQILTVVFQIQPMLQGRFKVEDIGNGDQLLTVRLDGSMIPWEEIPFDLIEDKDGEFDALQDKITEMTFTIALGVRGDYLLLSLGEGTDHLKPARGGKLLYDRKELAPLRKFADKRISGLSYVSRKFANDSNQSRAQLDELVRLVETLLPKAPIEEDLRKDILSDVGSLRDAIASMIPRPGPALNFSFLTKRGSEGYSYNWGENKYYDASQKLTLLNHIGGNPMFFYASRGKYSPEQYETMVKIFKRAYYYADKYGEPSLNGQQREQYVKYRDMVLQLLSRLNNATSESLIPALKDSQGAFVLDARIKSKQWHPMAPGSEEALPMIELALVFGVSDAGLLKKGVTEYFGATQEFLTALHKAAPDNVPDIRIPSAKTETLDSGTLYFFQEFAAALLDAQLMPNAALSEKVAVLSISPSQSKRILKSTPLSVSGGPLSDQNRPLASAASCDWPAFINAVHPWVEYATMLSMGKLDEDGESGSDENEIGDVIDQIRTGAEILKCYRGFSSATYTESDALVTHRESRWEDLKE